MKTTLRRNGFYLLFFNICLIATSCINAEAQLMHEVEYAAGMYAVDIIRMVLGIFIIIGAFGFFITTSARRAHWPAQIRRIFFGIFVFCNIFSQAIFNVFTIPTNKKIVCMLGKCTSKLSFQQTKEHHND